MATSPTGLWRRAPHRTKDERGDWVEPGQPALVLPESRAARDWPVCDPPSTYDTPMPDTSEAAELDATFSTRVVIILRDAGINTMNELNAYTLDDLGDLPGVGPATLRDLAAARGEE